MVRRTLYLLMMLMPAWLQAAGLGGFYGVWHGDVAEVQRSGQGVSQYGITLHIMPGSVVVAYPGLGCGGSLHPLGRRGRHLGFRDELDYGLDHCESNGRTELYLIEAGLLTYRWYNARGRLKAKGYLKRQRQLLVRI